MAWRETARAAAAPVRRLYRCSDCALEWREVHQSMDEPVPDCPRCAVVATWVPPMPGLLTSKSAAVDYAQKMAEEDYGFTNMRDNQREGDIAAMEAPAPSRQVTEDMVREMKQMAEQTAAEGNQVANAIQTAGAGDGFWKPNPTQNIADLSSGAAAVQRAEGIDAVGLLEAGKSRGITTNMRFNVVGREDMPAQP